MIPIKLFLKKHIFLVYSINMPNINQNNEIEPINKEINLLHDLLKKEKIVKISFKLGKCESEEYK